MCFTVKVARALRRFGWEVGHGDHLRESGQKARDPRKGYVRQGHEVVRLDVTLNLRQMELPLCSGVSFQM